jgi:hypothetical protein
MTASQFSLGVSSGLNFSIDLVPLQPRRGHCTALILLALPIGCARKGIGGRLALPSAVGAFQMAVSRG